MEIDTSLELLMFLCDRYCWMGEAEQKATVKVAELHYSELPFGWL